MHAWGLRLRSAHDALAIWRASQYCLPVSLTPSAPLVFAISELTSSGYPAYMCPCPGSVAPLFGGSARCVSNASSAPLRVRPHMARGQDGSLLLSCMTLAFTTSRRFIPTLSKLKHAPPLLVGKCPYAGLGVDHIARRVVPGGGELLEGLHVDQARDSLVRGRPVTALQSFAEFILRPDPLPPTSGRNCCHRS